MEKGIYMNSRAFSTKVILKKKSEKLVLTKLFLHETPTYTEKVRCNVFTVVEGFHCFSEILADWTRGNTYQD